MNKYLIKKFFKEMRYWNLCVLGLFAFSFSYEIPQNIPELFPYAEIFYKYFSNIALSLISAYIFFLVFNYFPEKKDELNKVNYLEHQYLEIITKYFSAYNNIFELGIKNEIDVKNYLRYENRVIATFGSNFNKLQALLKNENILKIINTDFRTNDRKLSITKLDSLLKCLDITMQSLEINLNNYLISSKSDERGVYFYLDNFIKNNDIFGLINETHELGLRENNETKKSIEKKLKDFDYLKKHIEDMLNAYEVILSDFKRRNNVK